MSPDTTPRGYHRSLISCLLIRSGELEPTLKDLKRRERARLRQLQEEQAAAVVDIHAAEKKRALAIQSADFGLMRKLPTKREFANSKRKWHKGIHYPYNVGKGNPT